MKQFLLLFGAICLLAFKSSAQTVIAANDAVRHLGETVSITDKVCSTKIMTTTMTQLSLGAERQPLIILYKNNDSKVQPDLDFKGREVTVTGKLITFNGKPGIMVTDPKKLKIVIIDNIVRTPAPVK